MNNEASWIKSASTLALSIDNTMLVLILIFGLALMVICSLLIFFAVFYRKDSIRNRRLKKAESLRLEWGWTIATLIIFLGIFFWCLYVYFEMHVPPLGAQEISVVGKQWMWKFQHPNGKREINELHIPINQPILLKMISQDVIHSLFVPAFRLKQDVLPGRYTKTWVEPSLEGEYQLFCTQYCGTMHSAMIGKVFVLNDMDYEAWLASDQQEDKPEQNLMSRGEELYTELGCISCHAKDGAQIGPPLEGLFGKKRMLTTGEVIVANDDYIRESILYPNKKIVAGYEPLMPTFLGRVSEEDLLDLIAYIKLMKN